MAASKVPSRWASEQFGDAAVDVERYVVKGLRRGQLGARAVQAVARAEGATGNHPYGSFWNTRYELVVQQFALADLPGFEMIKPPGASYHLAVVNGRVLIPFRHSTTMNKPIAQAQLGSLLPRRISREHGVLPERTLFDEAIVGDTSVESLESPTVGQVAADARELELTVVYIAYVANADSDDIQAAWWGTPTSLEDDGRMAWTPERMDLSIADQVAAGGHDTRLRPTGTAASVPGFAQGDEPDLDVALHGDKDELPASEAEPDNPGSAAENDE
ncbi:hypothetical protein [Actinokineospora sp. NBRC 105648]|uniref:hypothetical protein n=1 Tax=Actinokineospora sp. NBRC 105648 TaxID=3032206 RepID=UPI0025555F11|nr:hypothetical protein [Actinokineospora sp. NBRC 105648]